MNHIKGEIVREDFRVLIVYPNLALMLVPSVAVAIFTRIFKGQRYQVDLFDTTHYVSEENSSPQNRVKYLQARKFSDEDDLGVRIKTDLLGDFRRKVLAYQPHFMIVTVVEDAFIQAVKLLEQVADLNIPHLLGGVFPTASPETCFQYDAVNMIGLGEGERTVVQVAEAVRCGRPLHNIPGTWFRGQDGKIQRNPQGPLIDINEITPDFSLFDEARFYRPMGGRIFKTVPFETYRGCPYACTYCNSPMQRQFAKDEGQGNFLRRADMPSLHDRLKDTVDRYQPEFFYFIDDSFLARPKQEIMDFCDLYEDFRLPFWFNTRPENCDRATMKRLKEVGCYRISFGIECGNEEFRRKVLKRSNSNRKIIEHFEIIADSGIAFSVNLIIGMPGETRELIFDTIELVRSIYGYDTLTVSIFTPYHGTKLREVAVKNGWMPADQITKHTTSSSILKMPPPYLSAENIDQLMRVIPLYCYFPKSEWVNIEKAERDDEEGNYQLNHYTSIYKRNFLKENQDDEKVYVEGTGGCRSNSKDAFFISPSRLNDHEVEMLTA